MGAAEAVGRGRRSGSQRTEGRVFPRAPPDIGQKGMDIFFSEVKVCAAQVCVPRQLIYLSSLGGAKPKRVCENSPDAAQGDCQGFGGLFLPAGESSNGGGHWPLRPTLQRPRVSLGATSGQYVSPEGHRVCPAARMVAAVLAAVPSLCRCGQRVTVLGSSEL